MSKRKTRNEITKNFRTKGRVIIDWWDGEPVHRPMTPEERLIDSGIDPTIARLGIVMLSQPNYKPGFKINKYEVR